jgi:hypothetical protein
MDTDKEYGDLIRERFAKLPKVVQNAITSADVAAHMRQLAETHKLHLDQWESLENEVHLTLLGVEPAEELAKNIEAEVGVDAASAAVLAADIFKTVFEPIRQQLEKELQHPDSVGAHDTSVQAAAQATPISTTTPQPAPQVMAAQPVAPTEASQPAIPAPVAAPVAAAPTVLPATPPPAPVEGKVERAPLSQSYLASQPSHERKAIEGDPYREQLI